LVREEVRLYERSTVVKEINYSKREVISIFDIGDNVLTARLPVVEPVEVGTVRVSLSYRKGVYLWKQIDKRCV
jgi:hypothetical protein